jgi:hypothetical protein
MQHRLQSIFEDEYLREYESTVQYIWNRFSPQISGYRGIV